LKISVQDGERLSLEQIQVFLEGSSELHFQASHRQELYDWVGRTLVEQEYAGLGRKGKGLVRLTSAAAMGAIAANLSAVRFDPSNLGVTKSSESNWIVVDRGYSVDCFGDPESQVGYLTRELMGILGCEAFKLIRDQDRSFDRIRHMVSFDRNHCASQCSR
jgi:hypothetical protein